MQDRPWLRVSQKLGLLVFVVTGYKMLMSVMEWSLYCSPWGDLHLEWCTWLIGKNKKPKDDICSSCFLCFQLHILGNFGSMTWMERRLWSCALSNLIADRLERVELVSGMHQNSPQINFGNSLTLAPPAFSSTELILRANGWALRSYKDFSSLICLEGTLACMKVTRDKEKHTVSHSRYYWALIFDTLMYFSMKFQ